MAFHSTTKAIMYNSFVLPTPTAADLIYDRDSIMSAVAVKQALSEALRALNPATILTIASQIFPMVSSRSGAELLLLEIRKAQTDFEKHADSFKQVEDAERIRLAPMISAAVRRTFAIQPEIDAIKREIKNAEETTAKRREALAAADVSKEDIERLASAFDAAGADIRIKALQAEMDSLNDFLKTRNEKHLPAGFVVTEPLTVRQPVAVL